MDPGVPGAPGAAAVSLARAEPETNFELARILILYTGENLASQKVPTSPAKSATDSSVPVRIRRVGFFL